MAPAGPVPGGSPPGDGKATASMVLGIVCLVFAMCGCYGLMVTLPCGILAVIFGSQVKREAVANPALAPAVGKARAGVIMGWIGLGLSILFTFLTMGLGLVTGVAQEFSR